MTKPIETLSTADQQAMRDGIGLGDSATRDVGTAAGQVASGDDARLSNARDWTAAEVSQAEAEAGISGTPLKWSPLRVRQAIAGWWGVASSAAGRALVTAADAAAQRAGLGLGTAATTAASAYATAAQGGKADTAAQVAGDLAGTPAAPLVAKINGVAVSGTPAAGQTLVATGPTAAAWSPVPGDGRPLSYYGYQTGQDATMALQNAADDAITSSRRVILPDENLNISNRILFREGGFLWKFQGSLTTITQNTDNTPIFEFTGAGISDFEISGISFRWANMQPASNTQAIGVYFNNATGIGGAYNFHLHHCDFDKGFRSIAANTNPASGVVCGVWGAEFSNMYFRNQMSGGCIVLNCNNAGGFPNNTVRQIYARGDNVSTAEKLFVFKDNTSLTMDAVEINCVNNGSQILQTSGGTTLVAGAIRVETATFGAASLEEIIDLTGISASIEALEFQTFTFNATGKRFKCVANNSGDASRAVNISSVKMQDFTISAGDVFVLGKEARYALGPVIKPADVYLTDWGAGDAAGNSVAFTSRPTNRVARRDGTANISLAVDSEPTQVFYAMTADRSVTLPGALFGPNDLTRGQSFTFIKSVTDYTLTVLNASGSTVAAIAAGSKGSLTVSYAPYAWDVLEAHAIL